MTVISCGDQIWNGPQFQGSAGCLINFTDAPDRIMLVTAGHAILSMGAKQNDLVTAGGSNGPIIGRLRTWSELSGAVTVDAALIWVDRLTVSPEVAGLGGPPKGLNLNPTSGTVVFLPPATLGGPRRQTTIEDVSYAIDLDIPAWQGRKRYTGQLRTKVEVSKQGDSGAPVLDGEGRLVGLVVGGAGSVGDIITPIGAILGYAGWKGTANLVTAMPQSAQAQQAGVVPPASVAPLPPVDGTSFAQLKERYEALFKLCEIQQRYQPWVSRQVAKIMTGRARYDVVAGATDVPWWFIGIVHSLECGCDFTLHLHNGDPLQYQTVRVPAGRPVDWNPPNDWETSAVDAITLKQFQNEPDWTLARTLYRLEGFNGYGYYGRGINSPYLWSFSNLYTAGKFIADHVYSPTSVSEQCGAAVLLKGMVDAKAFAL